MKGAAIERVSFRVRAGTLYNSIHHNRGTWNTNSAASKPTAGQYINSLLSCHGRFSEEPNKFQSCTAHVWVTPEVNERIQRGIKVGSCSRPGPKIRHNFILNECFCHHKNDCRQHAKKRRRDDVAKAGCKLLLSSQQNGGEPKVSASYLQILTANGFKNSDLKDCRDDNKRHSLYAHPGTFAGPH